MSTLTEATTHSNTARSSTKPERPHRRLSLTRPTLPAANEEAAPAMLAGSTPSVEVQPVKPKVKKKRVPNESDTPDTVDEIAAPAVRVMAYLSQSEADLLDELWMEYRRSPQKPSKSDILRAALTLASGRANDLTATLSQQQTNTLSRQRVSKVRISDNES